MYQDYKNVELVKPAGLDLKDRLVGVQRVTKVTKGGRAFGFSAIVVVGDENGVFPPGDEVEEGREGHTWLRPGGFFRGSTDHVQREAALDYRVETKRFWRRQNFF